MTTKPSIIQEAYLAACADCDVSGIPGVAQPDRIIAMTATRAAVAAKRPVTTTDVTAVLQPRRQWPERS